MPFECKHCGQCCTDDCTQINLSLADIKRLCDHLKCDVRKLSEKIAWRPFEDPENPGSFDVEIGLRLPCAFRRDGRCSAYPARPLNCRMFPSVFLGNVPDDKLATYIDPTHRCVSLGINMSDDEKRRYREYAQYIGELILSEAEDTEEFYASQGKKKVHVDARSTGKEVMEARALTVERLKQAMRMIDDTIDTEALQSAVDEAEYTPEDEINRNEKKMLGR